MDNVFVLFAFVCLFWGRGLFVGVCFMFCLNFIWVCFKVHTIIVKTFSFCLFNRRKHGVVVWKFYLFVDHIFPVHQIMEIILFLQTLFKVSAPGTETGNFPSLGQKEVRRCWLFCLIFSLIFLFLLHFWSKTIVLYFFKVSEQFTISFIQGCR